MDSSPHGIPQAGGTTPAQIEEHAALRHCVLDEHDYRLVDDHEQVIACFRLQLFCADGQRPVAVVTQRIGEGQSVVNAAEQCVSAVWEQFFPQDGNPPIWIERVVLDSERTHLSLVSFAVGLRYEVAEPGWARLSEPDLEKLVGQRVDAGRGVRAPALPEPEPADGPRYAAARVLTFPRPRPFRQHRCMPKGISWWRRALRQLAPRRRTLTCCWYHGGDWHGVSAVAVQAVRDAEARGVTVDDMLAHVDAAATELSGWEREALTSLFLDPIVPHGRLLRGTAGWTNGQHRAQAMLDAGVRHTVIDRR